MIFQKTIKIFPKRKKMFILKIFYYIIKNIAKNITREERQLSKHINSNIK